MTDVVLELQSELRSALKEPFGPVETDTAAVFAAAGSPLVTVGDIVTYHALETGEVPDVALVDERTKRASITEEIRETVVGTTRFDREVDAENPPATLTADLLTALREAYDADASTVIRVDGEEDLAALPAIAIAPDGASVLYGQPDEGVVHVVVDQAVRERVLDLLARMDGDTDRALTLLGRPDDRD